MKIQLLSMGTSILPALLEILPHNLKLRRWEKCFVIGNKFMVELDDTLQHFDVEE